MSFFGKTQVNIPLHELVSKMPTYSNIEGLRCIFSTLEYSKVHLT